MINFEHKARKQKEQEEAGCDELLNTEYSRILNEY